LTTSKKFRQEDHVLICSYFGVLFIQILITLYFILFFLLIHAMKLGTLMLRSSCFYNNDTFKIAHKRLDYELSNFVQSKSCMT
jgi:hypothetical protein